MTLILSGTDGLSDVDGSAATPAIRGTDANTGIFFGTDIIGFSEGGVERARIDSSGNLGLGVIPSPWDTFTASFQIDGASLSGLGANNTALASNAYYQGAWKYYGTGSASLYQQNAGQHAWSVAGSGTAGNAISFTQALTLNANGALALQGAASANGIGITFPATQSASSDANTLDDYEEGTWTPAYSVASGSITANSNTSGKYTKIGNVVYIWGYISYQSNSSASGAVTITGLPFTSGGGFGQSTNRSGGVFTIGNTFFGSNSPNFGNIPNGGTSIEPFISTATGGTQLTFANFDTSSANFNQFTFAGQYTV